MTDTGDAAEPNLTRRTLGGFSWSVGGRVLGLVAQIAYTSVMARLLTPELFGIMASAQVVLLAGQILAELGIGRALVQADELSTEQVRAAFTASVGLGVVLTGVLVLAAPAVGLLFDDPAVTSVTRVMATVLIFITLGLTAEAMLLRSMRFKQVALLELGAFVVGYLFVGIGAGLAGAGVWSLVAAAVTKAAVFTIGCLLVARHPMRPMLAWSRVRSLYAFGSQVSVISVVEYLTLALPPTAISRALGQAQLGQFNQGNRIVELPFVNISQALSDVLFPAMARVKEDRQRMAGAYLTALQVTAGLLLPCAAGLAVASDEIVLVLLGDQWGPAAAVLPLLAFQPVVLMLSHYGGVVCEALGTLGAKLAIQVVTLLLLAAGFGLTGTHGLLAMVLAMLVVRVLRFVTYLALMHRILPLGHADQPVALLGGLAASAVVAAAIWGWTSLAHSLGIVVPVVLAGQVLVGAVALTASAFYGPLRGTRDVFVQRLEWAGIGAGGPGGRLLRVLRTGQPESAARP